MGFQMENDVGYKRHNQVNQVDLWDVHRLVLNSSCLLVQVLLIFYQSLEIAFYQLFFVLMRHQKNCLKIPLYVMYFGSYARG